MTAQTVTNLPAIADLLKADIAEGRTTKPLTVLSVDPAHRTATIQVASNADLKVTLRGVAGLKKGSTVTVNLDSGDVVETSAPAAAPKAAAGTKEHGCNDASLRMC